MTGPEWGLLLEPVAVQAAANSARATKKVAGFMRRIEQKASAMPIARHRHELDTGSGDAEGPPPGVRRASAWRSLTR